MNVPFLDAVGQDIALRGQILERFSDICVSGRFALGPAVEEFERAFAAYCEAAECVCVNSGTSALHLALRCLDVGPGDEVITTPLTFVATAWAITYVGAKPVFVDVDPRTRTLDPALLDAAITSRTRAILPVHLYGQPADLDPILAIAHCHRIPVVEDACQAHGAHYGRQRVGALGAAGCFSFYPGKNLGAYGEGGALVTNDRDLAAQARVLRDHGQRQRYHHETVGYNYRMDALQGAVLSVKLPHLDGWNRSRRGHAAHYRELLSGTNRLVLPELAGDREHVFHLFVVEVDQRDQIARELNQAGIQTGLHYPVPVHLQPAYQNLRLSRGSFPQAERIARRCLSLPLFPHLTDQQVRYVCDCLLAALDSTAVGGSALLAGSCGQSRAKQQTKADTFLISGG
jgi:dTDP-4-amino-4,6-dideoxygalactose transaminase